MNGFALPIGKVAWLHRKKKTRPPSSSFVCDVSRMLEENDDVDDGVADSASWSIWTSLNGSIGDSCDGRHARMHVKAKENSRVGIACSC